MAGALMAIMNGTYWVSLTPAAEASDIIRLTGQVKDQDGQNVARAMQILLESKYDGGAFANVRLASNAALAAVTAAGTGAGKTLTADANGALTIDSVAAAEGDRVLIKNQVAGANNGVYTVTAIGDGDTPFVLTRATDFDTAVEAKKGIQIKAMEGTANGGKTFVHTTAGAITIETTALTFVDRASLTVAELGGMSIASGQPGVEKSGSTTASLWLTTNSTGGFTVDVKSTIIGDVLIRATSDNGEVEQVVISFA